MAGEINDPHFEEMVGITVINGVISVGILRKVKFEQIFESSEEITQE